MLIAEIALSIWAWRRGWKGYSLLPVGLGVLSGFLIGIIVGFFGGTEEDISFLWVFDVVAIGVLILMIAKPRRKAVNTLGAGHTRQTTTAQHQYCPRCGNKVGNQDFYCRQCGQRLRNDAILYY